VWSSGLISNYPPGEQALLALRLEVREQHCDGLTDNAATVRRNAEPQQSDPGLFKLKQFLGRQVDSDLLVVLLAAAGTAPIAAIGAGRRGGTQEFPNPRQAYPP
jgi:hypothetical protein